MFAPNPTPTLSTEGQNFILVLAHFPVHDASFTSRVRALEKLLRDCQAVINDQKSKLDKRLPFKGMVVCPEYFFAGFKTGDREPLTELEKDIVHGHLLKVSGDYPDILLMPGTLFYAKSLDRPEFARFKMMKSGKHAGERVGPEKKTDRHTKVVAEMHKALSMGASSSNSWVRTTSYSKETLGGKEVLSMSDKYKALRDRDATMFCRNRAYILLGGKQVARVDKQTDFRESTSNTLDEMVFIPGTSNQIPEIAGLKFGLEICFDHGNGVLRSRGVPVHFHVVLSDWVGTDTTNFILQSGGFFIHASTSPDETKLYWNSPGHGITDLTTADHPVRIRHSRTASEEVRTYLLPFPANPEKKAKKGLF